jgi:glucose/arabinose dehydrogenase
VILRRPGHGLHLLWAAAALLAACGDTAKLPVGAGMGAQPALPAATSTLLPTVNIAPAEGWPAGRTPIAAAGLQVRAFASGLDHPRWLLALPNGDVLVAETNAPVRPDNARGFKGWIMGLVMAEAGAGTPSADRITLLRDTTGTGRAGQRFVLLEGLHSPLGMAVVGGKLYVANTDAVLRFPFHDGDTRIDAPGTRVVALPAGAINHHWTKNLIASADGTHLYVTVGSNSNVGERGLAAEAGRAAIWEVDIATGMHRVFASGLRDANGLAWGANGQLWTVVNERDEIGSDLVPDYLSSVHRGDFFGWPWSWYGAHVDTRVEPPAPERVAMARTPDFALGPHTASLGLAAATGDALGSSYAQGLFVGQHGSWNRRPHSGYEVIFVPFDGAVPSASPPLAVLGGFLSAEGRAYGRPVGVAVDRTGALLVADDVGNTVWRVSAAPGPQAARAASSPQ